MKVLMFGWEFPPHISGGLGTACFGLTRSLGRSGTQILFVVPKADAKTVRDSHEVISASDVFIPVRTDSSSRRQSTQTGLEESVSAAADIETIIVPSEISPYTSAHVLRDDSLISKWNYQFSETTVLQIPDEITGQQREQPATRYRFSGSYGPNLMTEVERYGLVGAEIARLRKFDIIHAHDWLTYPAGLAAKKISGKPLVVHVHATEYDRAGKNANDQILEIEREGMQAAERVVAVSQWTKEIITSRYGIPAEKIHVVHNGSVSRRPGIVQRPLIGKQVITFLGRITYQKGPQYFIDAAKMVLKKFPDVHFVMAGSGDLLPEMIERVARLRIASHFHFTGFLKGERVDQLWTASSVYVMPSVSEPFGISPLEAVQAGVPVIISKQSGVAEVMQHVIKVDFWDVEALANSMCNLLRYESLAKMLKNMSREEISRVTWKRAAKKVSAIYHELTRKKIGPFGNNTISN